MAMSETPSKPVDWTQFYHLSSAPPPPSSAVAESIVVTTTAAAAAHNPGGANPNYAQIEGRVGKSGRRRSRASRRAPTTLLNTDTTNFRAMVQQFTGVPTVPFSSGAVPYNQPPSSSSAAVAAGINGGMTSFGFGAQHGRRQQTVVTTPTPPDYYHLQQHQRQQQQQQEGAPFSMGQGHDQQSSYHPVFTNPRPGSDFPEDFLEIFSSSSTTPGQNNNNNNSTGNTHGYIL